MAVERVSDMSVEELKRLIEEIVTVRLSTQPYRQGGRRPMSEVVRSMREHLWTPPPGARSSLELLREDRTSLSTAGSVCHRV